MNVLSPRHPIWLAGFRPFFLLALLAGLLMPVLWGFVFSGRLLLPIGFNPMQWHAHEMFFGFAGAVLIGFLLTASKNWVKIRGINGASLMILVGLWIFERFFIYKAFDCGLLLKHIGMSLFFAASGLYIVLTLVKHRLSDSFKDNYFFVVMLCLLLVAKNLLISESYYQHGIAMTVGLFRLAFVMMFERTIPQFMKNTEERTLFRNRFLDFSIKLAILLSVFQSFFPPFFAATLLSLAAAFLFIRWIFWRPEIGFRKFGNATMYAGYFGLVLHLVFSVLQLASIWSVGTIALHVFTILCMGVVIPSMLVRISQGHTGRKPQFFTMDKVAILLIIISALFRLLFPVIFPELYFTWIMTAGFLWFGAFLLFGSRLVPFLLQPRIDGKEH